MKSEYKGPWVEALRSGKYKQGKTFLNVGNEKFCCLGVLCEINQETKTPTYYSDEDDLTSYRYDFYNLSGSNATITPPGRKKYGLEDHYIERLVLMNDDENKSFSEIADYIEANL